MLFSIAMTLGRFAGDGIVARFGKHRAYIVQTRRYATHNAQGISRCCPRHGWLCGHADGPAVIGFLSKEIGLHSAFWFLALLVACVPIFSKYLTVENPY
jgi:hypothetical protein